MTQTIKAEAWTQAKCEGCKKTRNRPVGRLCGWCESGGKPARYRVPDGRSHLLGLAREMEDAGVNVEDLAHEIKVPAFRIVNYVSFRWTATDELAEAFALYLDTTVEELRRP